MRAPVTRARVAPAPHDRTPLPLVRAAERAEQALDRTLLVLAGIALLLVASGGAVGLVAVRRELEGRLA